MAEIYQSELLNEINNIQHGFFGKNNLEEITSFLAIKPQNIVIAQQSHSNIAVIIDQHNYQVKHAADSLITQTKNLALGILTADCTPILIADKTANIIAAIHAGWRGSFNDIIENCINNMKKMGATTDNMIAAIGPTVSCKNYEVHHDFYQKFINKDKIYEKFFYAIKEDKFLFDLPGFNRFKLLQLGINTQDLKLCTYANEDKFYSYRRSSHKGEIEHKRQLSVIMLK